MSRLPFDGTASGYRPIEIAELLGFALSLERSERSDVLEEIFGDL